MAITKVSDRFEALWLRWFLPTLVFALLAMVTILAWRWQTRSELEAQQANANQESASITAEIRDRLRLHAQFLRSLQAFAAATGNQDLSAWQRYAENIEAHSKLAGLYAFAFAPSISADRIKSFIASQRTLAGRGNFRIFPLRPGESAAPAIFIAPQDADTQASVGFNLLAEPTRRQAIENSLLRRDIALSGPVVLNSDQGSNRLGFLMVHALYRDGQSLGNVEDRQRAFSGVVLTAYRTNEFLAALRRGEKSDLALQVFDESLTTAPDTDQIATLIYDSDPALSKRPELPKYHHEVDFGGRNWILVFRPRIRINDPVAFSAAGLLLYGGLGGSALLALLVFHLGTHRTRAERYARALTHELREHRDNLQGMVSERTARLNEALQQAQAANVAKSEFLANMSHELRTPMHAILSFAELGADRSTGQPKLVQYFNRIEHSAHRLLNLINDLLDLSKLDAGKMDPELRPTRVDNLIEQTISQLESLLLGQDIDIELINRCPDQEVIADPKRILQVVHNLLSNAIKFSPEGGRIRIELTKDTLPAGRRADDTGIQPAVTIRLIDQGVGIPESELESIFDKFVQSSATKSGAGGTGLGLAICRRIVVQHRGTITATNNQGGGACFTVTLPINGWTEIVEANEPSAHSGGR